MALKKIEFITKNPKSFSQWLKKFVAVDISLLLEIDLQQSLFLAKSYNAERSVVKFSKITFEDAGLTLKHEISEADIVKIGIYNITRIIKLIDQFKDTQFEIIIDYETVNLDTKDTEETGSKIVLKNKQLKISEDCTSLRAFRYISNEVFENNIANVDDIYAKFNLTKEITDKINSLSSLDIDSDYIDFKKSSHIYAAGKTFELKIGDIENEWDGETISVKIFKNKINTIDAENYVITMGDDRLIFTSNDQNTSIVISRVEE